MEGSQTHEAADRTQSIVFRTVKLPLPLQHINLRSPSVRNQIPASPPVPSFCFNNSSKGPSLRPLLNIEDVRAFFRSKLGPHTPQMDRSSTGRVHAGVFGIGTTGFSGSDGGYVPLSSQQANEHQGEISSHPFSKQTYAYAHDHMQNMYGEDRTHNGLQPSTPLLDLDDVRYSIDRFLHVTWLRRHPTTSLANRLPWYEPRPPFLARGLEWPPDSFESEEARKTYYRKARKRKPYMLGSPPLWTVTAFNLVFLQLIMYNPVGRFYNYLMSLP